MLSYRLGTVNDFYVCVIINAKNTCIRYFATTLVNIRTCLYTTIQ